MNIIKYNIIKIKIYKNWKFYKVTNIYLLKKLKLSKFNKIEELVIINKI